MQEGLETSLSLCTKTILGGHSSADIVEMPLCHRASTQVKCKAFHFKNVFIQEPYKLRTDPKAN